MTTPEPLIACLCPTYKRPDHLRNSIACFEAQDYGNATLLIVDDANQHTATQHTHTRDGWRWELIPLPDRFPTLTAKFNAMAAMAPAADILAIWEDDDVYLPHHLRGLAAAWDGPGAVQYFAPERVLSTYRQPMGGTQDEGATGRFHASWAYTRPLWDELGGYPDTTRLDFDQQMGKAGRRAAGGAVNYEDPHAPSYVYRWGNGVYHGSQAGEAGFVALWDELGRRDAPHQGTTGPRMDEETRLIYRRHGHAAALLCTAEGCDVVLEEWEGDVCEGCG